jgi:hypothetical protein
MYLFGLRIGGAIRRDLAAIAISVPLLSFHARSALCWVWLLEFYRYRPDSGCRHRFLSICLLGRGGGQPRLILDLFWLGSLQLMWQPHWMRYPRRAAACLLALMLVMMAAPAFAADIEIGKAIGDTVGQLILAIVGAVVSYVITWLAYIAKNKFNIEIESQRRDALKAFIDRQAASLVADGRVWLNGIRVEVNNEALAGAANAALQAVPQARDHFGLSDQRIAAMIVDALPRVPSVAAAQSIALDVVNPATPSQPPAPAPQPVG